ncbi:MAG: hypothetical protein AAF585_08275, partial [Verrucomicrobiota bacterium]
GHFTQLRTLTEFCSSYFFGKNLFLVCLAQIEIFDGYNSMSGLPLRVLVRVPSTYVNKMSNGYRSAHGDPYPFGYSPPFRTPSDIFGAPTYFDPKTQLLEIESISFGYARRFGSNTAQGSIESEFPPLPQLSPPPNTP